MNFILSPQQILLAYFIVEIKKKKKKIIWILDEYDARGIKFILLKYKVNYNIYYYHTKCH